MYNQQFNSSNNGGEAYISVQKNRIKVYGTNVHLKDKQEFEIELFNPSIYTKAAKISMNGKLISTAGIVLKPGQRAFLDRFIDTPKKFLFETYEVEDSKEAKAAIANNGEIEISFYDEDVPVQRNYLNDNWNDWKYTTGTYTNTIGGGGQQVNSLSSRNTPPTVRSKTSTARGASMDSMNFMNSVETGRVEQGDYSNQRFSTYSGKFKSYPFNTVRIKILPFSQKPIELQELAEYCVSCGTKNKKGNYKYCPKCGTQF